MRRLIPARNVKAVASSPVRDALAEVWMKKLHVAVLVFLLGAGAAPFSSARATILPLHLSPLLLRATTLAGDLIQRVQANPADKC